MRLLLVVLFLGCDAPSTPSDGGTPPTDGRGPIPGDALVLDAGIDGGEGVTTIAIPADGAEVIFSVPVRIEAPMRAARVEVAVDGRPEIACNAAERAFECLLDASALDPGPFSITARALDASGAEIATATRALVKRAIEDPCASGDVIDCVNGLATAGEAAGFAGVTYLNCDDLHARYDTSRMTGIDARVRADVPTAALPDVMLGIANESRACNYPDGWMSIPRCYAAATARTLFDANVLVFWPEHRDHGMRDYYQWQSPFFVLSQGSSGSELDEVQHALLALGALRPSVREGLREGRAIAPALFSLLRRARVASDLELMSQEGQVLALRDADVDARIVALARAIRDGELPPIAQVVADATGTPWALARALSTPYAFGFAPSAPLDPPPSGRFVVEVDLSASRDPDGDALSFFPALLRGDPADVTIERASEDGAHWTITGSHPLDRTIATGGHDRIVSRVTVAFFPHDGHWLGAPAMVSIGGRPAGEHAPDSNDLD